MAIRASGDIPPDSGGYRPEPAERQSALERARRLLIRGDWDPVDPDRLAQHLRTLNVYGDPSIHHALLDALGEIEPVRDYRGDFPPELSYHEVCPDAELFPFGWRSRSRGCDMYLKFCFFDERLKIVSFHQQKKRPR